jgi:hypothetical protein
VLRYLSSGRTDQWRAPELYANRHVRSSPARGTAAETAPTGSALRVTRRCISVLLTYLFIIWVEALWTRETRGRCRLSETACAPTDGPRKRRRLVVDGRPIENIPCCGLIEGSASPYHLQDVTQMGQK